MDGNIRNEPEWIPREDKELADYYSMVVNYDNWMLNLYGISVVGWPLGTTQY